MYNHTLESTLDACNITADDLHSLSTKLYQEVNNEPYSAYTAKEQTGLLILATSADKSLLANTLNFVDESIFDALSTHSEVVEALEKYPPTAEQIIKVLAMRHINSMYDK